jgi:[ribosomal protein S5]-alanine N-acetyltransferase
VPLDDRANRVRLQPPEEADRRAFAVGWVASRELHDGWIEPADPDQVFDRLLARNLTRTDRSMLVRRRDDGAICGVYNVSQIFLGPFRSAYLGYYALEPCAGKGYMREGMLPLFGFAFGDLGLHRLQANVQPENERSIALVRSTGFTEEGFARRYLQINGQWRDHLMFAVLAEDVASAALGPKQASK